MRNPERIDRILKLISVMWHQQPDLRLGQFLYFFADFKGDIFPIEDTTTEQALIDGASKYMGIQAYDKDGNRML